MNCSGCGYGIEQDSNFCGRCGAKVVADAISVKKTAANRVLSVPNYIFFALFVFHFASYIAQGYPAVFAFVRTLGLTVIPLGIGIFYVLSGSKGATFSYVVVSLLFWLMSVAATLQTWKEAV